MIYVALYGMLANMPQELRDLIEKRVLDEKHVLARLLLRIAISCHAQAAVREVVADMWSDMKKAIRVWNAIASLACYDDYIIKESRHQHDIWYQLIEDPYEMRADMPELSKMFASEFVPILGKVASMAVR